MDVTSPLIAVEHLYDHARFRGPVRKRFAITLCALARRPSASLPQALGAAGYTGLQRLLHHPDVTLDDFRLPVLDAAIREAHELGTVLAVHDTTDFSFGGQAVRPGL